MDCVLVFNMILWSHLRIASVKHKSLFDGIFILWSKTIFIYIIYCTHIYRYPHTYRYTHRCVYMVCVIYFDEKLQNLVLGKLIGRKHSKTQINIGSICECGYQKLRPNFYPALFLPPKPCLSHRAKRTIIWELVVCRHFWKNKRGFGKIREVEKSVNYIVRPWKYSSSFLVSL